MLSRRVDRNSRRRGALVRGRACSGLLEAGYDRSKVLPQVGQNDSRGWPTGGHPEHSPRTSSFRNADLGVVAIVGLRFPQPSSEMIGVGRDV